MTKRIIVFAAFFIASFYAATVQDVINNRGCDTGAIKGLSLQLVDKLNLLKPGLMTDLNTLNPNPKVNTYVDLGGVSVPFAQTAIFNNLLAGIKKRGTVLKINR